MPAVTPRKSIITRRVFSLGLLLADSLSLVVVFSLLARARDLNLDYTWPVLLTVGLLVSAIYLIDGYNIRTDMMSLSYTSEHGIALCATLFLTLLVTFVLIPKGYSLQSSRSVIALGYLALIPITLSYRRLLHQRILARRRDRYLLFIGDAASCVQFNVECQQNGVSQSVLYSTFDSGAADEGKLTTAIQFGNTLTYLNEYESQLDAIILRETNVQLPHEVTERLLTLHFTGVPTFTLELFHQVYWRKIPIYRLNQVWIFQEGFQIAREPVFERLKRGSDLCLAAIGLILATPVLLLAALAIKLNDGGEILFRQTRVGRNRHLFCLYKLRTMRTPKPGDDLYTRPDDGRITRVGAFLRQTRIDEIPQLINVLRGDMSMIGPRAEWVRLVEDYENKIPCYYFRHLVRPGITGWAQVNYPYGEKIEDTVRKLEYDLYYIRHFSFVMDASIVLKTIHIMLFGKGR